MAKFLFVLILIEWLEEYADIGFLFQWDSGNETKNFVKHGITTEEAESAFQHFNYLCALGAQISPTCEEDRYGVYGTTNTEKQVFICFTIRENSTIRIISIRELNSKEKIHYEKILRQK